MCKTTNYSYKQQHQTFIQHATQQINLLETQKQALEQQAMAKIVAPKQIPPLLPPGVDPQPPPSSMLNKNYSNQNLNNGKNNNIIRSTAGGPVPLMSQPVSMPNLNLPPPPQQQQKQQAFNNSNSNNIDISNFHVSHNRTL